MNEHVALSTDDSVGRRRIFTQAEQQFRVDWAKANYRSLESAETSGVVKRVIDYIFEHDDCRFLSDEFWFGGPIPCGPSQPTTLWSADSARPLWSLLLMACATRLARFSTESGEHFGRTVIIPRLKQAFPSADAFVESLMENDERLLHVMLALLEWNPSGQADLELYDPILLFLTLLIKIEFDPLVVTDWLSSEPIAIPFALRYLKAMHARPDRLLHVLGQLVPGLHFTRKIRTEHKTPLPDPRTRLTVSEVHGDQVVERVFDLGHRLRVETTVETFQCNADDILDRFRSFLVRFENHLSSLQENGLFPFNVQPIVNAIDRLDNTLDQALTQ